MTDIDKAIRAAKLTAAGLLDKARAKTAVTRAGGQIAPSKYLPNVPRQVHANGGRENGDGIQAAELVAKMLREGRASEVTNDHLSAADPQHLSKLYETGKTGMDLPMDHASRMERAKAMGFDTKAYHGTHENFPAFDNRAYAASNYGTHSGEKDAADTILQNAQPRYAKNRGAPDYADRAAVLPLMVKTKNNLRIEDTGTWEPDEVLATMAWSESPDTKNIYHSIVNDASYPNFGTDAEKTEFIIKKMSNSGHTGFTYDNQYEGDGDSYATLNPANIRSQFARFDPRLAHLSHLSAATGGRIGYDDGGKVGFLAGNHPLVPDVLYHGSAPKIATKGWTDEVDEEQTQKNIAAQDFREFKPSEYGNFGPGIYLSDSPKVASDFAQGIRGENTEAQPHGHVFKLHVSMKNPFTDRVLRHPAWKDYIKDEIKKALWLNPGSPENPAAADLISKLDNDTATVRDLFLHDTPHGTMVSHLGRDKIHDTIRNSGFDGIIAHRPDGSKEYVAFHPTQVKSATGNQGTFDPTEPDMTKAEGGRIHANKGGSIGARTDFLAGNHPEVPNVVYHATKSDFHAFRPMSHFGTQQAAHDRYSPDRRLNEGMSIIPAHISLKNPLDVGLERDWQSNRDTIRQAADAMFKSGRLDQDYLKAAEKLYDLVDDPRWGSYHQAMEQRGADLLREAGHDGIIYTNNIEDPGSRSFVTLGPEQVKSSIGNQGTFDPAEPDMTKADGGSVGDEDEGITAYHGSPHDFDEFDIARLGTGEGAQAYGHGLYFAGNEQVAKNYRNNLSGSAQGTPYVADEVRGWLDGSNGDYEKAANEAKSHFREFGDQMDRDQLAELKNAIYLLDKKKEAFGHIYKVKLNVKPHELLDWDAPLAQQPAWQKVRQHWDDTKGDPDIIADRLGLDENSTGQDLHRALSGSNQINAAIALSEAGLKGIRYRDAGSRDMSDGDPTHNYVMFHHDPVKVVDKYEYGGVVDNGYDRIRRADGGRLSLYSKAAQIIRGMKDQPMQAADILEYAKGKGAKKTEIAHVNVPPGKATPSQVADHIERMQPQIGVTRRGEFMQGKLSDAEVSELMGLISRSTASMSEQEIERQEELEAGAVKYMSPLYTQYQLPGGDNYREHILTLDNHEGPTYNAKQHWGKTANPLAHIRMSDRMIGNKKILHVEELQSDWNNDARKQGFRTGNEQKEYDDYVSKMREDAINGIDQSASPIIRDALRQKYSEMDPYMLSLKMGRQREHNGLASNAFMGSKRPPKAPYINPEKDDVYEMAMKHILTEAAKGGYDGIAFTPDEEQELRWPGHTFKGIYNKRLPGIAQRLVQPHDPENDVDDMTHLQGWAVPMIPLSDKARDSITQNGFSSFKRGGAVGYGDGGEVGPDIQNPMSIFPKPQRMFPEDQRPAGGQYLAMPNRTDVTGHRAETATIGVAPGGKPFFRASQNAVDQTGSSGRGTATAKTNLFKQKAGWRWNEAPEGHEATDTIVSVEHRGKHYYTLNAHFPKGVDLARYENAPSEPRLRPTTRGNVELGPQAGSISVRGKLHPVYHHVIVKADGGSVDAALAATRRFTKDGQHVTMRLKD